MDSKHSILLPLPTHWQGSVNTAYPSCFTFHYPCPLCGFRFQVNEPVPTPWKNGKTKIYAWYDFNMKKKYFLLLWVCKCLGRPASVPIRNRCVQVSSFCPCLFPLNTPKNINYSYVPTMIEYFAIITSVTHGDLPHKVAIWLAKV